MLKLKTKNIFVIFGSVSINKIIVGGLAFGINSGAYVAEIVRSGIMSIDQGQTEAGRSLGLNFSQTMRLIIIPQAFKNVLPALVNEFIVLIKETSIIGYIGMMDLTKGAMLIQSRTYNAFWHVSDFRTKPMHIRICFPADRSSVLRSHVRWL